MCFMQGFYSEHITTINQNSALNEGEGRSYWLYYNKHNASAYTVLVRIVKLMFKLNCKLKLKKGEN